MAWPYSGFTVPNAPGSGPLSKLIRPSPASKWKPYIRLKLESRPAGMVWGSDYCVHATGWTDESRTAVGYTMMYGMLVVVQWFKIPIRQTLTFAEYYPTRDAVRYVVLGIEILIAGIMARRLYRQSAKRNMRQQLLSALIYVVCFGCTFVGLILAQHNFVEPLSSFMILSRVVDPIATIGSLAAMIFGRGESIAHEPPDGNEDASTGQLEESRQSNPSKYCIIRTRMTTEFYRGPKTNETFTVTADMWVMMWAVGVGSSVF